MMKIIESNLRESKKKKVMDKSIYEEKTMLCRVQKYAYGDDEYMGSKNQK